MQISGHSLYEFSGKCPETPNLTCFTKSKWRQKGGKSTDRDHDLISSEGGQDTSACKIWGHFLHAFSSKYPETSPGGRADGRLLVWTNHNMMQVWTGKLSELQLPVQPENIMPPEPNGRGIKGAMLLALCKGNLTCDKTYRGAGLLRDLHVKIHVS